VGGAAAFLTVIALAIVFWPNGDPGTEPAPAPVSVDSVLTPAPVLAPRIVLGDTTIFSIVAARDTLNPVRVTADFAWLEGRWMRLSSPLTRVWIEIQDTLLVKATDRVELGNHGADVDVIVRGVQIPTRGQSGGGLILTREAVQAHLDSLRQTGGLPGA
jgi:hypothetical protein